MARPPACLVTFEQTPISFEYLRNAVQVGLNLVEVVDPTSAPTYTINSTCVRFPSTTLSTALLSEVQQVIPLVHIRVRESAVADIYLSDRRVTVGGQLYLPRLIGIGEPGSDVLISQDIKGTSDNVRFTFGNGDRVMTQLANDTDLKYAEIDLCLFHVNSGILLQLWKGVIQNFTSDGTPIFPVTCSDGFFQIMNQYPERQISRQCWKTYNDGVNCPWATKGAQLFGGNGGGRRSRELRLLPRIRRTDARCTAWPRTSAGIRPTRRASSSRTIPPASSASAATPSPQRRSFRTRSGASRCRRSGATAAAIRCLRSWPTR